jgi:hypothetical protein
MEAAGGSRSRSGLRGTASLVTYGSRHEIEAKDVLQRMVVDAGGGLYGGGRVVAASQLVDPERKSPTAKRLLAITENRVLRSRDLAFCDHEIPRSVINESRGRGPLTLPGVRKASGHLLPRAR